MANTSPRDVVEQDNAFRARLGIWLVVYSAGALVLLAIVIMIAAMVAGGAQTILDAANLLLTALLPLFGTWVGTVLAFYYTRANFEAASKGTLDVVKTLSHRLTSTKVSERMMPTAKLIFISVPTAADLSKVSIKQVMDKFDEVGANGRKISRLIFVDQNQAGLAILHKSIWVEILNELYKTGSMDATKTLDAFIDKPISSTSGKTVRAFATSTVGFISGDQSMAEAKAKLEAIPQCQDLFVTATGQTTQPLIGWLSNVDIATFSQA